MSILSNVAAYAASSHAHFSQWTPWAGFSSLCTWWSLVIFESTRFLSFYSFITLLQTIYWIENVFNIPVVFVLSLNSKLITLIYVKLLCCDLSMIVRIVLLRPVIVLVGYVPEFDNWGGLFFDELIDLLRLSNLWKTENLRRVHHGRPRVFSTAHAYKIMDKSFFTNMSQYHLSSQWWPFTLKELLSSSL